LETLRVLGIVALVNAVIWGLFFWQRSRLKAKTREAIERSGQVWVIPPENAFYQGMLRGFVSTKTMGAMGLTEAELIFIPPLGPNKVYQLRDIVGLDVNRWFAGNYRNGKEFMIIKLVDGNEVGFQVSNHQRWMEEIRSRILPVSS